MSDVPPPAGPAAPPPPRRWRIEEAILRASGERRLPHVLLGAVAAFCVLIVAWAAWFEIDEVARGEGRVVPRSQVQVISNLEGGIVQEILVREGDLVEKGQPLARIDEVRFQSALREGEQGALALKATVARLSAETAGRPLAMPAEVSKAGGVLEQRERDLHAARQAEQAAKLKVLRDQLAQRESEARELQNRELRLAEQQVLVDREVGITAPLVRRGVVAEVELLRLEREQTRTRAELEQTRLNLPRARAAIDEARARIADADATFRAQAGADLAQAQAELAKLAEQMPALEDRANRTLVRAPMRGVVKLVVNRTVGGVVQPGSPILELVPAEDSLLVEARIRPADVAFVRRGQRALVKVSAYDYSIFGGLEGEIANVSADSVVPQQGEPYYVAMVRTRQGAIDYHGRRLAIEPGMLATVDVITGRRTILYYLAKPVNRARERALSER